MTWDTPPAWPPRVPSGVMLGHLNSRTLCLAGQFIARERLQGEQQQDAHLPSQQPAAARRVSARMRTAEAPK